MPYADSTGSKKRKKKKRTGVPSVNPVIGPPTRPTSAVVNVDRGAGLGHWKTLNRGEVYWFGPGLGLDWLWLWLVLFIFGVCASCRACLEDNGAQHAVGGLVFIGFY